MDHSGHRVVGRDENDAVTETNQSDLRNQQIETRIRENTDLSAKLILVSDTDSFGIVGSSGSNASIEVGPGDVLPLKRLVDLMYETQTASRDESMTSSTSALTLQRPSKGASDLRCP